MGWLIKLGLCLLMLAAIAFSAWIVVLPIGVYFAFLLFHRGERPARRESSKDVHEPGVLERIPKDKMLGVALVVLAVVARAEGGTYSVALFLSLAAVAFFRRPIAGSGVYSRVVPVENSTLIRKRAFPIQWYTLAEVKPSRGTLSSVLSTIREKLIVSAGERVSLLVAFETYSLSRGAAESALIAKIRKVSKTLAPLGAYLLPLDSNQACAALKLKLERERIEEEDWPTSLEGSSFNMIVLKAKGGFIESFGAYTAEPDEESRPGIPAASQRLKILPLLVEALEEVGKRLALPQPDGVTSFLSSLYSARGEAQGQVLQFEQGGSNGEDKVKVKALSSPTVEIGRTQLRALARVYMNGKS
jgi:hypothetical protein